MSVKINWRGAVRVRALSFNDLALTDRFVIDTAGSRGAVYEKVELDLHGYTGFGMKEEETGKVFKPTTSPVKLVDVEVNIDRVRPRLYA